MLPRIKVNFTPFLDGLSPLQTWKDGLHCSSDTEVSWDILSCYGHSCNRCQQASCTALSLSKSLTVEAPSRSLNRQVRRNFLISNCDDAIKSTYSECQGQNSEENDFQANPCIVPPNRLLSKDRQDVLVAQPIQGLTANNPPTQNAAQPE